MTTRKKKANAPVTTPEQFLSTFPIEMQILATELRDLIKSTLTVKEEKVSMGWQLIGYRVADQRRTVYAVSIVPRPDRVDLYFENGILMHDPDGLLQAGAKMKQVRYVPLRTMADLQPDKLATLIREAARVSLAKT
jgi:hypothetical protein